MYVPDFCFYTGELITDIPGVHDVREVGWHLRAPVSDNSLEGQN